MGGAMMEDRASLLSLHVPEIQPMRVCDVVKHWDALKDEIVESIDLSPEWGDTLQTVLRDICAGNAVMHSIVVGVKRKGVFVTYVKERKDGVALHVWQIGGHEMEAWLEPFLDYLKNWARIWAADLITFGGRKGWEKVLQKHGYEVEAVKMRYRLADWE
jgi:hypothetical protein